MGGTAAVNATASAPYKRVVRQTPVQEAGAVVVTVRYDGATWETRVDGGPLDAWTLAAKTLAAALGNHRGAVRLVREAARTADEQPM
jgi:hypothetical protein